MENLAITKPDYILVDDDECVQVHWKFSGKERGIVVKGYLDQQIFLKEVEQYPKDTPIYIDSNLGKGQKGEDVAKVLYEKGFCNIYLTTGTAPENFPNMPWIKKVIGKTPPWVEEE